MFNCYNIRYHTNYGKGLTTPGGTPQFSAVVIAGRFHKFFGFDKSRITKYYTPNTKPGNEKPMTILNKYTPDPFAYYDRPGTNPMTADPEAELAAEQHAKEHQKSVLEKAQATVVARQTTYGPPAPSFERVAQVWSAILGFTVTAEQVVRCMIGLKTIRLSETPHHEDSILDIAGYAWVLDEVRKSGGTQD